MKLNVSTFNKHKDKLFGIFKEQIEKELKKHIIKNYNYLLTVYNQWITLNPDIGLPLEESTLDQVAQAERDRWNPVRSDVALFDQPPIEQ